MTYIHYLNQEPEKVQVEGAKKLLYDMSLQKETVRPILTCESFPLSGGDELPVTGTQNPRQYAGTERISETLATALNVSLYDRGLQALDT